MIKKTIWLLLLLVAAYAGFRWGGAVFPAMERGLGIEPAGEAGEVGGPTPELAEETLDRFERFRAGEAGDRLALGGDELSAVVRYALPGIVPSGVSEPTVDLADGDVHLSARVAVENFPKLPRLEQIVGLLPDTVLIEVRGSLVPVDQRTLALLVDRLRAAKIPIPGRMVAEVLEALGRQAPASLPSDALPVPKPDGVETVFVQRDSLILLRAGADASAGEGGS